MVFPSVPSLFLKFLLPPFSNSPLSLSSVQSLSLSNVADPLKPIFLSSKSKVFQNLDVCRLQNPLFSRNWKKQRTCMLLAAPPTLDSNELYLKKHLKNSKLME